MEASRVEIVSDSRGDMIDEREPKSGINSTHQVWRLKDGQGRS